MPVDDREALRYSGPSGDERARVLAALEHTRGNRIAAARLLGVSRATLYRRLTEHGIPTKD